MERKPRTIDWRCGARLALAGAALAGAALAAGCGGGDEDGGAGDAADAGPDGREADTPQAVRETTLQPTDADGSGNPDQLLGGAAEHDAGIIEGGEAAGGAGSADAFRTYRIPAGTRIGVTVDEAISTDVYRPGDAVVATVAQAVVDPAGTELIPAGAKLLGRITMVRGSQGVGEDPVIEMYFETLSALNAEWPVEGAVVRAPVALDPEADARRRLSRSRSGRDAEVPGEIAAGGEVEVELRAPVRVSPMVVPVDSLSRRDSVPGRDGVPGGPGMATAPFPRATGTAGAATVPA